MGLFALSLNRVCKDSSKKFCPSCGNPTLIRASVSARAPDAGGSSSSTPDGLHIHLKPNFQYRTRGTVYSIPAPKMGSSKGQSGGGSGLILREDQKEFMSAVRREEGRRKKEDRKLEKAVRQEVEGKGKGLGGWNDPDVSWSADGGHCTRWLTDVNVHARPATVATRDVHRRNVWQGTTWR